MIFFLLVFGSNQAISQNIDAPRFFKISFQNLGSSKTSWGSGPQTNAPFKNAQNHLLEAQLRCPILLKGKTRLIAELGYNREDLFGFYLPQEGDDEELGLHKVSLAMLVDHRFDSGWRWMSKWSFTNNAHQAFYFGRSSIGVSAVQLFEKNIRGGRIGLGARVGYRNQWTIFPLFSFQKDLDKRWEIDMVLPVRVLVSNKLTSGTRIYGGVKGSAGSYFLGGASFANFDEATYRRISVHSLLGYERQITSLVGLSVEAGATLPVRSSIYEWDRQWIKTHDFSEKISPYFKVGLFLSIDR